MRSNTTNDTTESAQYLHSPPEVQFVATSISAVTSLTIHRYGCGSCRRTKFGLLICQPSSTRANVLRPYANTWSIHVAMPTPAKSSYQLFTKLAITSQLPVTKLRYWRILALLSVPGPTCARSVSPLHASPMPALRHQPSQGSTTKVLLDDNLSCQVYYYSDILRSSAANSLT